MTLFALAIGLGVGYWMGGHPDQVKTRAGLLFDWIKTKFKKGP